MRRGVVSPQEEWVPPTVATASSSSPDWPTSTVDDASGRTHCYTNGDHDKRTLCLPGKALEWPTAAAADGVRESETYGGGNRTLLGATKEWQTPSTGLFKYRRQVRQTERGEELLPAQAENWPTPKAQNSNAPAEHGEGGAELQTKVMQWATPTSRDWKDGADPSPNAPTDCLLGRQAPRSGIDGPIFFTEDPTLLQQYIISPPEAGRNADLRRRLNPFFVEYLLGLPIGWTASAPVEMRSFLSWRQRHTDILVSFFREGSE